MSYLMIEKIWPIMEEAFPPIERRDYLQQKEVMEKPGFSIEIYEQEQKTAGFITYWYLNGFIYIEHLAVDQTIRGKGIGKILLQKVLDLNKTVVLEVEPPVPGNPNAIENKRIAFYEKMGFILDHHKYFQPAYDGSGRKVRLCLMANLEKPLSDAAFADIENEILAQIHGVKRK